MTPEEIKERIPQNEFLFTASRSSGPGGQNVNKVSTRVELRFNISASSAFSDEEKNLLFEKLKHKISLSGDLIIRSQRFRSQLKNRLEAVDKVCRLLAHALAVRPERIETKPTLKSVNERLEEKKNRSRIKKMRKEPD